MIERITVYYDGVVGPNEQGQLGAFAYLIFAEGDLAQQQCGILKPPVGAAITTAVAEYMALTKALDKLIALEKTHNHVRVYGDNMVIVNHLTQEYPFKPRVAIGITPAEWRGIWEAKGYEPLKREVVRLAANFRDIQFTCVNKNQITQVRDIAETELAGAGIDPVRITRQKAASAREDE